MGRRSINTTKSGKYMNPTDQARKEARKKELKKNKKQRQMVRAAVLKGKDPSQLIEEMEKIDEMEYNVYQPSPLNEKVLREKRKKLKETFDRVMRLYHNDDPDLWTELKRKEVEYEKRRNKRVQYFESVKHAQTVQIDEIPLPQVNAVPVNSSNPNIYVPGRIPLPTALPVSQPYLPAPPAHGILKKHVDPEPEEKPIENKKREPPGCPPGPPPDLFSLRLLDSDYEPDEDELNEMYQRTLKHSKTIRFSDEVRSKSDRKDIVDDGSKRSATISGQNIDDFMKEMETVHKRKEQERAADLHRRKSNSDSEQSTDSDRSDDEKDDSDKSGEETGSTVVNRSTVQQPQSIPISGGPPPPPVGMPPAMLFRPPPLRPSGGMPTHGIRMPPGPPPGRPGMPAGPPPGMPPRLGIRMPPGPPPGLPPARIMHNYHNKSVQPKSGINTVTAAPQLTKDNKGMTTITAKPQIRNLSADVTRFVPSALRVKRDERKPNRPKSYNMHGDQNRHHHPDISAHKGPTKDDAYMQFMREMQGLL